jgi:hypothetical protein
MAERAFHDAGKAWRWQRNVYCAPNPATALADVLVQIELDASYLPDSLRYLEIEAPDTISPEKVDIDALGRS